MTRALMGCFLSAEMLPRLWPGAPIVLPALLARPSRLSAVASPGGIAYDSPPDCVRAVDAHVALRGAAMLPIAES